jgi:uncharacterized RDD family membrane protein YckC
MSEPSGMQYGGFWIRFLALLADSAIVFALAACLVVGAAMALGPDLIPLGVLVAVLVGIFYWPVMHASARQASIGKAILGLKVARLHGGRISMVRSVGRELSKILSGMLLLLGYVMAAFTPRKQTLHDLVASTYVVREGVSRVVPAVAVAVAGFVLPVVLVPMLVGGAVMSSLSSMAEAMVLQSDPMKLPAKPAPKASAKIAKTQPPMQVAKLPASDPKPAAAPTPNQIAAVKPEPISEAKPVAAVLAEPATPAIEPAKAQAEPVKPKAETVKPKAMAEAKIETIKPQAQPVKPIAAAQPLPKAEPVAEAKPVEPVKPKAEPVKPKAAAVRVAQAPVPPSAPMAEPKAAAGPKFNDLMTAVLYRDAQGVSELLRLGKWPDKPDSRGVTPLMTAAELGDMHTAEALLRGGANPYLAVPVAQERKDGQMIQLLKRYSGR